MTDPRVRAKGLEAEIRRVAGEVAEHAEHSARVHDEVAEVHEELGEASLLDPAQVREHAAHDRECAEQERRVASGEVPTTAGLGEQPPA